MEDMWIQASLVSLTFLAIQVAKPAEGELLETTFENLTYINFAWEACNKVGDDDVILDGMDQILETQHSIMSESFEGKISEEHLEKLLLSEAKDELELLTSFGILDLAKDGLDNVFLELGEYCKVNTADEEFGDGVATEVEDVEVWADSAAFGRDMVGSLFRVWDSVEDDDNVDEYNEYYDTYF